jgi:hypothetical protein
MMKVGKLIVLLSLAVVSAFSGNAQQHYEANVSIGGKAGATMSKVNFQSSVPQTFLPGVTAGLSFRYTEERNFGIVVELNYEQGGWKETFEDTDFAFQKRLDYLRLPMLTQIYFGSSKFHAFFTAGPEIGYMIGNSTKSNFDYQNVAGISGFPIENRNIEQFTLPVKYKFDYGISAGLGLEFIATPKHSIVAEGRFYYGLHDVFGNHAKDAFSASSGMSVQVTLGYYYRIR